MQDIKIDLVYLWVNDKDEKWQEKKRYWANKLGVLNCNPDINADCRYADNSELRYSLRSAEMYAPWINKIFIITDNQVPEWLDTSHPKIRIIDHKEIMPEECLPCFNSAAIETFIANIPELSEYFLYANDDTFFTSQVEPNDFYDSKGNPIIQLRKQNWTEKDKKNNLYIRTIIHSKNLFTKKYNLPEHFNFYEPAHCIDAYRKSYFIECKNIFKEEFEYVSKAKFRKESTLQRYIINLYSIVEKGCQYIENIEISEQKAFDTINNLYSTTVSIKDLEKEIKLKKVKLLCLNDSDVLTETERASIPYYLNKIFSEKQSWEKFILKNIDTIKNKNCIVFSLDTSYIKYFSVALKSLIENTTSKEHYDIVVLHNGISEYNQKICKQMISENFNLRFFNMSSCLCNFMHFNMPVKENYDISTYYRVFIPFIFKNYEKVLYCDSDIIFNSSIQELFEIKDEGKEILGIIDSAVLLFDNEDFSYRKQEISNHLGLKDCEKYFNAGIVLFYMKNITNLEEYSNRLCSAFNNENLPWQDQDILNLIFANSTKLISWTWNFQYHLLFLHKGCIRTTNAELLQDFSNSINNPKIIHFTSNKKPWHYPDLPFAKDFWQYARKSPYYEEILQSMTEKQLISSAQETMLYINCQSSKRIVLWGASLFLEKFLEKYNIQTNNIIGIIDKNPCRKGDHIGLYEIFPPEAINELKPDEIIITIINSAKERALEVKHFIKENYDGEIEIKTI